VKVVVEFDCDADIIDCPDNIIDNLIDYSDLFLKWLFDKNNNHSYWMYEDGNKYGGSYRSEAFVEWLNIFILGDLEDKAKVLERCIYNWDHTLPTISF
jgi:hypothetical protein